MTAEHHQVLIIGGGISGLAAFLRLRERGIEDVVILEVNLFSIKRKK
jgi:cation diffusion facilitator CzcD-associated flavoprotein CzcO